MEGIGRDAAAYGRRLLKQPIGSLPGLATFALAVVSGVAGRSIALAPWGWGLLAMGGVVLAGFLDWRSSRGMTPEHSQRLREVARSAHDSLDGVAGVEYRVDGRRDPHIKRQFHVHFPELADLLNEWERLPAVQEAADLDLKNLVFGSSGPLLERHPDWNAAVVVNGCWEMVRRNLSNPPPLVPTNPQFLYTGAALYFGTGGGGEAVRVYGGSDEDHVAGDAGAAELKDWATQMHASPEADRCRAVRSRREELRRQLQGDLQRIMYAPKLRGRRCAKECEGV